MAKTSHLNIHKRKESILAIKYRGKLLAIVGGIHTRYISVDERGLLCPRPPIPFSITFVLCALLRPPSSFSPPGPPSLKLLTNLGGNVWLVSERHYTSMLAVLHGTTRAL